MSLRRGLLVLSSGLALCACGSPDTSDGGGGEGGGTSTTSAPKCGNGILEGEEACDYGSLRNGKSDCTSTCQSRLSWTVTYPGTSRGMVVDGAGNAVVVGTAITRLAPDGTQLWSDVAPPETATAVEIGADGTIFVAGSDPAGGGWVRRYSPEGQLGWTTVLEGFQYVGGIAVAGDQIFVAGADSATAAKPVPRLARLAAASGSVAWYEDVTSAEGCVLFDVAALSGGDVVVAGATNAPPQYGCFYVHRYGPQGEERTEFGPKIDCGYQSDPPGFASAVAVDAQDHIFVVGAHANDKGANTYRFVLYDNTPQGGVLGQNGGEDTVEGSAWGDVAIGPQGALGIAGLWIPEKNGPVYLTLRSYARTDPLDVLSYVDAASYGSGDSGSYDYYIEDTEGTLNHGPSASSAFDAGGNLFVSATVGEVDTNVVIKKYVP